MAQHDRDDDAAGTPAVVVGPRPFG